MNTRTRVLMVAVLLGCLFLLTSCGDSGPSSPPPVVSVSISPSTSTISVTETAQFTASVSGSSNSAVTWSASSGTVVDGLFTPPLHSGSYTVTATSQADSTKSASATVNVTAPAAEFSTDPVLTASEGMDYVYTVEATDPVGTEVSYSLEGPDGATIEGNVITWQPTPEQSRVENTFTVTATTEAGGVGTQTWTVTPTGTIYGTYINKFWTADGESTDVPYDMSGWYVAALVPQEDGPATEIPGTANADGTFTIAEVPAGYYWLVIGDEAYWTDTSSFDYGEDYTGRPFDPDQLINTNFAFNLFNLNAPMQDCCWSIELLSPNADVSYTTFNTVDYGETTFQYTEGPVQIMPIDPTLGDVTYVNQWDRVDRASGMALKAHVEAITSSLVLDTLTTNPEGTDTTAVEGMMGGVPSTFDFNVKGTDWAKMFIAAGPGMPQLSSFQAGLFTVPFVTDKFAFGMQSLGPELAYMESDYTSTDQDMGVFRYINPYPAEWKPLFIAQQQANVPVYVPGSSYAAVFNIGTAFLTDTVPTGPISPIMSIVKNPTVNGADFFGNNTTETPTVTLAWDAPTGLAPFGYEITVYYIYDGGYIWEGSFYTANRSVTIPNGWLESGSSYTFLIVAMADARANIKMSPWRHGLPMADAGIVSGPVTIGGEINEATFRAKMKAARTKAAVAGRPQQQRDLRSFTPLQRHAPTK